MISVEKVSKNQSCSLINSPIGTRDKYSRINSPTRDKDIVLPNYILMIILQISLMDKSVKWDM